MKRVLAGAALLLALNTYGQQNVETSSIVDKNFEKEFLALDNTLDSLIVDVKKEESDKRNFKEYMRHTWKEHTKTKSLISKGFFLIGGAGDGLAESLKFHYDDFKRKFPNANDQYWDPDISWRNKYKNGDPAQGPKYFGSTTIFVGFTDGYHMGRLVRNTAVMTGITFVIGENKKWHEYVMDFIINSVFYSAGFNITYEWIKE